MQLADERFEKEGKWREIGRRTWENFDRLKLDGAIGKKENTID